jgi:L-lactate dehydrogenase complex protein LldG
MSSREDILQSIRRNTRMRYEKPDLSDLEHEALTYEDKVAQFCNIMKVVGGQAVVLQKGEDVNEAIKKAYPDARRIASVVPEVKTEDGIQSVTCGTFHPDDVEKSGDLDGTDLAIVDGRIGVCENGAVWLQQDVEQRAVYFISEALVILLDRKNLVNNMHEAYKRIDTGEYGYGVFISGPSKTADIEQALVMGAHGARSVTVILL